MTNSDVDWCWGDSSGIDVVSDKHGMEDIWCDTLKVGTVVLSVSKWVPVEHMVTDSERSRQRLCGLPSRLYHSTY